MNLQDWLRQHTSLLCRDVLRLIEAEEGGPVEGDDPNLLGLDIHTYCGGLIREKIEAKLGWSSRPREKVARALHDEAKVILYG